VVPNAAAAQAMGDHGKRWLARWLAGPKGKSCVQGGMHHLWLFVFIV